MKLKTDIELKLRRFFRRFGRIIIVVAVIISIIIVIDRLIGNEPIDTTPSTTYTPNVPVLNSEITVPKKVHSKIEDFVNQYAQYCNDGNYSEAYNMISEECKKDYFGSYDDFVSYVRNKFYNYKKYAIQSYDNYNNKYIYSLKLFDDFLATGLTNSTYSYQEEKIIASYDDKKNLVISVGNFIEKNEIQSVQENNYLKVDVKYQIIRYEFEQYSIKLTNRSDYTIIIQNGEAEDENEIGINLGQEIRENENDEDIILEPGEVKSIKPVFQKFYDDGDTTKEIIFSSVRVLNENGAEIEKFSMNMGIF